MRGASGRPIRRARRAVHVAGLGVAAVAAALALTACGGHGSAAPAGAPVTGAPAGTSTGLTEQSYQQMAAKVDAADSAASAAESDANASP